MQFNPQKAFDIPQQILYQIGGGSSHDVYKGEKGAKVTHLNAYLSVTQGDIGPERALSVLQTDKFTPDPHTPRFIQWNRTSRT